MVDLRKSVTQNHEHQVSTSFVCCLLWLWHAGITFASKPGPGLWFTGRNRGYPFDQCQGTKVPCSLPKVASRVCPARPIPSTPSSKILGPCKKTSKWIWVNIVIRSVSPNDTDRITKFTQIHLLDFLHGRCQKQEVWGPVCRVSMYRQKFITTWLEKVVTLVTPIYP